MFVLEALLLTCMTTPLVTTLYPPEKRKRVSVDGANFLNVTDDQPGRRSGSKTEGRETIRPKTRLAVVLDKVDHLPSMMALTRLLHVSYPSDPSVGSPGSSSIDALRLIELSDRTSAVMKSSVADTLVHTDPLLAIFRTFGELHGLPVSTSLSVVPYEDLARNVAEHAYKSGSELILVPWLPQTSSTKLESNTHDAPTTPKTGHTNNPFDALFRAAHVTKDRPAHAIHSQFIRSVFSQSLTDVALFVDQGHATGGINAQHIFLPFFGGPDDRLALELVVQLCSSANITATVMKLVKKGVDDNREVHFGVCKNPDSNHAVPEYQHSLNTVRLSFLPLSRVTDGGWGKQNKFHLTQVGGIFRHRLCAGEYPNSIAIRHCR